MAPILARYGSIFIYSYTIVLATGFLLAVLLTARLQRTHPAAEWFDAVLVAFIAALVGGRLGFIIGQWAYFREQPQEIWQIWQGGLSYHGALFAGLAALLLWARAQGRDFYTYAALLSSGLALLLIWGWLACWSEGCAYGREALPGLLTADLPDEFGVFALRYQTQLAGFVLALAAFLIIYALFKRLPAAKLFWAAMLLISIAHLIPSLFRGDPVPSLWNLRLDVLLDSLLIVASFFMLQFTDQAS